MLQQPAGYLKSTTEKIAHISCLIWLKNWKGFKTFWATLVHTIPTSGDGIRLQYKATQPHPRLTGRIDGDLAKI
jgi:hypothetical protein